MKLPRTFKLSETTDRLLGELAVMPEYGSKTRVIETLIWNEGQARRLVKPSNGRNDPRQHSPRKNSA
jgi:hypothetical protein